MEYKTIFNGNKFRAANGLLYLRALFAEVSVVPDAVLYSLKNVDTKGYPSLYRLYMEMGDPTEYKFAEAYFENWAHWEQLCETPWFKPIVSKWRRELEVRVRSTALANAMEYALGGSREAVQVNKWLVEGGYIPKENRGSTGAGRPSKELLQKEARQMLHDKGRLDEDFERIVASTGSVN